MKELRDLKDLMIHFVQPISYEKTTGRYVALPEQIWAHHKTNLQKKF